MNINDKGTKYLSFTLANGELEHILIKHLIKTNFIEVEQKNIKEIVLYNRKGKWYVDLEFSEPVYLQEK